MKVQVELFENPEIETVFDRNDLPGHVVAIKAGHVCIKWLYGQFTFLISSLRESDGKYYI